MLAKTTLLLVALVAVTASAAPPPPKAVTADYDWRVGTALTLEGRGFADAKPYTRVPERLHTNMTDKAWALSPTTIGFNARFVTDSDEVVVRWRVKSAMPIKYMTPICHGGVDVYARTGDGKWRHVTCEAPDPKTGDGELRTAWKAGDECLVYLPVRAQLLDFAVGVKKGHSFDKGLAHRVAAKPVVIYGTSIVNGGSASRPGLIFTSIMGRHADVEVVNLGFSGAGKMELPMADLVADVDAALYILDCEHNMRVAWVRERYEPFLRRLKTLRPNTPVLLCGGCTEKESPMDTERASSEIYAKLKAEDPALWADLHYLSGVEQLPKTDECTHDHCHPNDFGFMQMGNVYADKIKSILEK
ncbi:MAG: SGNH/GDSL hydrolase family protein [Kiritimatiellae bacterium]|nr:SGNH/GDSL hydrolase family protein [Kiritimatiellia bacterium]